MAKLSSSQKQLLALFRKGLRCIRQKPESAQPAFLIYLRQVFRAPFGHAEPIARRDFSTLDYFHRMTHRTMDNYFVNESVRHIVLPDPLPLAVERLGSARRLKNGQWVDGQRR